MLGSQSSNTVELNVMVGKHQEKISKIEGNISNIEQNIIRMEQNMEKVVQCLHSKRLAAWDSTPGK